METEALDSHLRTNAFPIADKSTRFFLHLIDAAVLFSLFLAYVFYMENQFGVIQEGDYFRPIGGLLLYLSYYTGFEYFFSRTPGKFMTRTKVVNSDGEKPHLGMLIIRNASRLIPFDDISYLLDKRGWHDRLSKTLVVRE